VNSVELDLTYGLIGLALFIFKNPQRRHVYWISFCVLGLFLSQFIYANPNASIPGQLLWIISAIGLVIFYYLRFRAKERRRTIDYLKLVGLFLLICYPLPFYSLVNVGDSIFWPTLRLTTFFIVGIIFAYDRWILKPETMKKKFIITLVIQSVMILLIAIYAFIQKSEADTAQLRAVDMRVQAEKNAAEVVKLRQELENAR
jgi:hypothetical protein